MHYRTGGERLFPIPWLLFFYIQQNNLVSKLGQVVYSFAIHSDGIDGILANAMLRRLGTEFLLWGTFQCSVCIGWLCSGYGEWVGTMISWCPGRIISYYKIWYKVMIVVVLSMVSDPCIGETRRARVKIWLWFSVNNVSKKSGADWLKNFEIQILKRFWKCYSYSILLCNLLGCSFHYYVVACEVICRGKH